MEQLTKLELGRKLSTGAYLSANVLHRLVEAAIDFYKGKLAP